MARLAIFIDGGCLANLAEHHFRIRVDHEKLGNEIRDVIAGSTREPLDLLRTYFYDCLPYQSNPSHQRGGTAVQPQEKLLFRLAAATELQDPSGASHAPRRRCPWQTHLPAKARRPDDRPGHRRTGGQAADHPRGPPLLSGDSDLLPAVEAAQQEGVAVWLVHGPQSTYARELWNLADDRFSIDRGFMQRVERSQGGPAAAHG